MAPLLSPAPTPTEAAHAQALQLLERHGVVTRETVGAEGVVGGFSAVYGVLKVLEERGRTRRGYFVAGLGAAQFALAGAVDRLRAAREPTSDLAEPPAPVVVAATDPAQLCGASLPWPPTEGRPQRTGSAVVVLRDGSPLVWFDRRSHHLVRFPGAADDSGWIDALVATRPDARTEIRKVDGDPVPPEVAEALREHGFVDGYRGLVAQPRR